MNNTRRSFLKTSLLLGAGSAFLSACGDDDVLTDAGPSGSDAGPSGSDAGPAESDAGPAESDAGPVSCDTTDGTIGSNHGHAIEVPAADVEAGVEVTYDIQGSSGHAHEVTVSAANFAALAEGPVTIESTIGGGHTHSVTITCA